MQRACTSILSRILLFQWHPALTHEQSQWNLNVGFSFLSPVREKGLWVETDLGGNLSQCQRLENGTVFRACHNKRRSSPDITLVTALIAYQMMRINVRTRTKSGLMSGSKYKSKERLPQPPLGSPQPHQLWNMILPLTWLILQPKVVLWPQQLLRILTMISSS